MHRPIYLDYQATTPLDHRVLEAMLPYFRERFGNPHSVNHAYGWEAEAAVDIAREQVAALINAEVSDVIFTSGATESNNLAIKGVAHMELARGGKRRHIITVATEHKCVLESVASLEREGFRITILPVENSGLIDLNRLSDAMSDDTFLLSVMAVNNEIGVIQPLAQIGAICRKRGIFFHSDAAQAFGKIPLDVERMGIDLLSISAHKIYGPKGVGALYVRSENKRVQLLPILSGGGQELGLRSGTIAVPLVVGLGVASQIAMEEREQDHQIISVRAQQFWKGLSAVIPGVTLHGDAVNRIPGNLNFSIPGVVGERFITALKTVAVSAGAACASASHEPSYVLKALHIPLAEIRSSIRVGIGRMTTEKEITDAIAAFTRAYRETNIA